MSEKELERARDARTKPSEMSSPIASTDPHYSIKLDVLRALVAERHAAIIGQIYAEESKPVPDAARIADLDEARFALPSWGSYPDADGIDEAIDQWKTIIDEQRRSL